MEDKEIFEALQKAWDDGGCCEMLLSSEDLKRLIELLMDIFEQHLVSGSKEPISLQFLAFKNVNSAFIRNIKVMRLHTLYKFSWSDPAENCKIVGMGEIEKEILDFESDMGDILEAIAQG